MRSARAVSLFPLVLLAAATTASAQDQPAGPSKATLAVSDFSFTARAGIAQSHGRHGTSTTIVVPDLGWTFETSVLTDKFTTALVKTGKFDVVERAKIAKLIQEHQFGESGIVDKASAAKSGQVLGADYFLQGSISVFDGKTTWVDVPYTEGEVKRTVDLQIIVDMQIVEVRTSKIVKADKGEARKVESKVMHGRAVAVLDPATIDGLERDLCDSLVLKVIDAIYPIKIIGFTGGVAFVNRGEGGGLKVGDVLDTFNEGEDMVDPDTGESLGKTESKVGCIRIDQVLAKFSKASVLGPPGYTPVKGQICRRSDGKQDFGPPPPPPPPQDTTPPTVEILAPKQGAMLNSNPVNVVVAVNDDSGKVSKVLIVGRPATQRPDGRWELKVKAVEGGNKITAEAWDAAGNRGAAEVIFNFKERPPEVSGRAIVLFKGKVDDPKSKVTVNGQPVTVNPDGSFELQVKPDENGKITVVATDEFGNEQRQVHDVAGH